MDSRHQRELTEPLHKSKEHRRRAKDNRQEGTRVARLTEDRVDPVPRRQRVRVGSPAQVSEARNLHQLPRLEAQEDLRPRVRKGVAGKD